MAPKFKFQEGEKVLCFHGLLLYEAKCVKAEVEEKEVKYFIHYSGWNKKWDEWVPENRVLSFNNANLQRQKELQKTHVKPRKAKAAGAKKETEKERCSTPNLEKQSLKQKDSVTPTPLPNEPEVLEGQKKKLSQSDAHMKKDDLLASKVEIKVNIPEELKSKLVDDWDLICRQKMLVKIPARFTVEEVLNEYVKQKTSAKAISPNRESAVLEVANGIKKYFNVMLGKQLLYKFERPQYGDLLTDYPDKPVSQLYGAVHLLRLFVKLGGMLAYTPLDEISLQLLLTHIHDFLKYLSGRSSLFSLNEYVVAPPEYHRKAI